MKICKHAAIHACTGLAIAAAALFSPLASAGPNLILNAGAEAGDGSPSGGEIEAIPSWTTVNDGNFTVVQYNASGFPTFLSPGPSDRGQNFFSGGPINADSSITQMIDLSFAASAIAAGGLGFNLSGWLGGFEEQNDHALLSATWYDFDGVAGGSVTLNSVSAGQRENGTGMLFRSLDGFVPTTARSVLITLEMVRTDGVYNDGYADNLSFSLGDLSAPTEPPAEPPATPVASIPEPQTYALMFAGLVGMGAVVRRKGSSATR